MSKPSGIEVKHRFTRNGDGTISVEIAVTGALSGEESQVIKDGLSPLLSGTGLDLYWDTLFQALPANVQKSFLEVAD